MNIGTTGYATNQGIGILLKQFHEHGLITHVGIKRHPRFENHNWYKHYPEPRWRELVEAVDLMLFIEKPFDWGLLNYCHSIGVPTVIMPMYECVPEPLPVNPTALLFPSLMEKQFYSHYTLPSKHIPIPVEVPWRQRVLAQRFVHNAGHIGMKGRNGTGQLVDAMKLVKTPVQLTLRSQVDIPWTLPDNIKLEGPAPYKSLWREGDVFVFPDKFGGLSLPLQEAHAAGMLVLATDRFPTNEYLPGAPLIPPLSIYKDHCKGAYRYSTIDMCSLSPRDIAETIDYWYEKDISEYSRQGKHYAEANSWEVLLPKYMDFFMDIAS